jgi:hypothetical protein
MLQDGRYASLIMLSRHHAEQLVERTGCSRWAGWLVLGVAGSAGWLVFA